VKANSTDTGSKCFHCGDDCNHAVVQMGEKPFCCEGCKTVYQLLNENGLCTYYDLNQNPGVTQKVPIRKDKFAFLDSAEVKEKLVQFSDGNHTHVTFYLPQIHCSSCLWLLENIYTLNEGVVSSRVNFTRKEVFIIFDEAKTSLREVVESLASIGYEPHLSLQGISAETASKPSRSRLYKIGIAGFCFSNIMMMSLPEYFGGKTLEADIAMILQVIIVGLSLPVFFYCSSEFFFSAWYGLKNKYLNIDAPVALALLITFGRSMYDIFSGTGTGYLDSMSGIVFFMLVGRWLQERTYQTISFDRDFKSFFPIAVNVINKDRIAPVSIDQIKTNDVIQVHSQEIIPVDALLSKGKALIDYSFVSGESLPVTVQPGELIYAGGKQMGGVLELVAVKEVSQSYLTNLWNNEVFRKDGVRKADIFDLIGEYFTYLVFVIGGTAGLYWYFQNEYILMWNAITTVLIIACPCALLLAANFTNGNMLRILGLNKFYLRNPDLIEEMSRINHLVFDKTGTLTRSRNMKVVYSGRIPEMKEIRYIASLLRQSSHPASKAIFEYIGENQTIEVTDYKEIPGKGIEAWIDDHYIKIGSTEFTGINSSNNSGTVVHVMFDGVLVGAYTISNTYRFGIFDLIRSLKKKYAISLISGDNDAELATLKSVMGDHSEILFEQKPEEKLSYIHHLQANKNARVMMIGDGLNDAGALKQSNIGIAVTDSNNTFTPASDGIIDASKLSILDQFLAYARSGKQIVFFTFSLSLVYNIIGLYFAVQGILAPVIAAILMPSSSITIILITYGMSQWKAKKHGLQIHDDQYYAHSKPMTI
jgi:P-type Cu+ transporter